MSYRNTLPFQAFWSQSWSAPLRASCRWLRRQPGPVVAPLPNLLAPGWLRPLCVQRQIAAAVQARLAWRKAHPEAEPYWAYDWSGLHWDNEGWTPYKPRWLRDESIAYITGRVYVEVERLVRLMQVPPSLLGEDLWTHVALGTCERLAQLYKEVLRRAGRQATRRWLGALLENCVCWNTTPEPEKPQAQQTQPPEAAPTPALEETLPIGAL